MNAEFEDQQSNDDLPVEVLEKVFLALDSKSLKNCCLVNKKWNNVIGQSSSVMKKLPLRLFTGYEKSWSDIYHATKIFERKFYTIHTSVYSWDEYAIKSLSKFAAECRQIQFLKTKINNEISMESLKFPLLESAKIAWANEEFASSILKVLSSSKLKHLSYEGRSDCSELMTFLSTQKKLTKLDLNFLDRNVSFGRLSDIERIQIPLKSLSLIHTYKADEDPEMLAAFLSRFTETLEDLSVSLSKNWDLVFNLVFTKFNKLRSLTIDVNSAPQENSFDNKLRPNYSVKKLVVEDFNSNNKETFNRFIELLPNVETLELTLVLLEIPDDALLFVSNHLKRLTTLHIGCVNSYDVIKFDRVHFPNVKTIVFGQMEGIGHEQWKLVVDAMPNVESMSIKCFVDPKSLSCRSIKIISEGLPKLISLKFGCPFVVHDQIFIQVLRNCKNIKTVELKESAFKSKKSKAKILKRVKKHGLRLIVHKRR